MVETARIIAQNKVIAALGSLNVEDTVRTVDALVRGGIRVIEVPFRQNEPGFIRTAMTQIFRLRAEFGGKCLIGAGNVLTEKQLETAFDAGAKFIMSPNADAALISLTREKYNMVSIPGVMTPTEIEAAYKAGAEFVKLFPAGTLGIRYARDIMAPLSHIRYIAGGGISEDNFADWLDLGFAGAEIGGKLTDRILIREKKFSEITVKAQRLVSIAKQH